MGELGRGKAERDHEGQVKQQFKRRRYTMLLMRIASAHSACVGVQYLCIFHKVVLRTDYTYLLSDRRIGPPDCTM
jgi:hypothetical protein